MHAIQAVLCRPMRSTCRLSCHWSAAAQSCTLRLQRREAHYRCDTTGTGTVANQAMLKLIVGILFLPGRGMRREQTCSYISR